MGFRLILFLLVAWLVYIALRRSLARFEDKRGTENKERPEQQMVQCRTCGTHVPAAEAIERDGESFCCLEHADQATQDKGDDEDQT